jgi:hypothetical protein
VFCGISRAEPLVMLSLTGAQEAMRFSLEEQNNSSSLDLLFESR